MLKLEDPLKDDSFSPFHNDQGKLRPERESDLPRVTQQYQDQDLGV